ncbi:acetolactate synthase large subunit [Aquabacter sp. CN5-332]|uniref:acetolactate synthase large subunit n=1 Tax=Aquabacter sp. CN5-332 TaxID=3156608 RepID=UPI0032B4A7A7
MNGADRLCDALLVNGVDVCFANPGTSEMHFVAALDRKPQMRCVLGLFEGVVTGAADGYARMAEKPAATLLHLGPGLANGLANIHNAKRARTPMINVVGDHASYHLQHDAPLTSDIEGLARPMSHWVGRATGPDDVAQTCAAAYAAAMSTPGISTMILPADAAWSEAKDTPLSPTAIPVPEAISADALKAAVAALRSGRKAALLLAGGALREGALVTAGRIAAATGASLFSQVSGRGERGAGRVYARPVPYPIDMAITALADLEVVVCIGGRAPVGFFAYPGKPGVLLPPGCEVVELARQGQDLAAALDALADALNAPREKPATSGWTARDLPRPTGALNPDNISLTVARALPEGAIICDEALTSGGRYAVLAPTMAPHDHLPITGGSIGIGIPLATGAAVGAPGRKVVTLQADGSGMYTVQGLWTQAREKLDVVTIVFSNRAYAILQGEMRNVGVNAFGRNASRMLNLNEPDLDWVSLAKGMGVEAARATTIEEFMDLFDTALKQSGPFLIEAVI